MSLTCPVCGYDRINEPSLKWSICPSCGTQFGLSDNCRTWAELRHDWIYDGAAWQDGYIQPPPYWSPISQFRNIGYKCTPAEIRMLTQGVDNSTVIVKFSASLKVSFLNIRASSSNSLNISRNREARAKTRSSRVVYCTD